MTHQVTEKAQFFVTAPSPCPYLEGKQERKVFTHLNGRRAASIHQLLSQHGFRRSQNLVYRPACDECAECKSARVVCSEFVLRKRHRRLIRRNADLSAAVVEPVARSEHYNLFMRYLNSRHENGSMTEMSFADFECMVQDTPVDTILVEYRLRPETADKSGEVADKLVAVALCDVMADGYSMVYSFFDPDLDARGLGNFMVLDHIARAQREGFAFVYLGYWVANSPKMHYKSGFKPLEVQALPAGWQRLD
ncbi:MAG TPA: arginyltransferase [Devosia sp.]|nr:arginyltransferase [Devosia sp.]